MALVPAGWHRRTPTMAQYLDPPTEIMFDLASIHTDDHVLDVAAGSGAQTILAARRVGSAGFVLATDLSPAMLAFAETEIQHAGLSNVEKQVMDADHHSLDLLAVFRIVKATGQNGRNRMAI